jgi:SAM-dependent methyltransferase
LTLRDWAAPRASQIVHVVGNAAIDRLLGTSSSQHVSCLTTATPSFPLGRYEPSPWLLLFRSLRALKPGPHDVLVDLGCGKGRVLLAAMSMPFQRLIGVELSPELAAEARVAVERHRFWMRAGGAEVIVADAAAWPLPDDVTVIYMYNPFWGSVFAAAVDTILESVERRPRRLRLVYDNPFEHNYLLSTNRFVPVELIRPQGQAETELRTDVVIYEVLSSAGERRPVGPVGDWVSTRDTSNMMPGFQPMITGRSTPP